MKVISFKELIDLEPKPKKIRLDSSEYEYSVCADCYINEAGNFIEEELDLLEMNTPNIKILEEDKQIEKIKIDYARDIEEKIFYEKSDKPNHCILGDAGTELLINKINEIIDTVNELKKEGNK